MKKFCCFILLCGLCGCAQSTSHQGCSGTGVCQKPVYDEMPYPRGPVLEPELKNAPLVEVTSEPLSDI